VPAGFILFAGLCALITTNRAADWTNIGSLSLSLVQHHPQSARSNFEAGRLFTAMIEDNVQAAENASYYSLARQYFTSAYLADEFNPAGLFGILYLDSLVGKPEDLGAVAELKNRLSKKPVTPATASSFTDLHKCRERQVCRMDSGVLISLYETALSNPRVGKWIRATLANELAMLHLAQGDTASAVESFKRSIAFRPAQPQLRFNLVAVLIAGGRLEEAREELILIREKFPSVREEHKLRNLERMYANASSVASH
jgi:tetratricopeptide (TPR) repeat protein